MSEETRAGSGTWLDRVERLGNALPDPTTLFMLGAVGVMVLSQLAVSLDWRVEKTVARELRVAVTDAAGAPVVDPVSGVAVTVPRVASDGVVLREQRVEPVVAKSLFAADGLYWALSTMVKNLVEFPPLGVVLVGMLGIGVAERSGLIGAALKALMRSAPPGLLTPLVFFSGVMSSLGLDAGYVVLPPLAAALYKSVGRSPLVGLGAVFAGVSAGFSANLVVTSLDPMLAQLTSHAAHLVDPNYEVAATANWWFMIASTFLLTAVGWAVTSLWVEPRFRDKPAEDGGPTAISEKELAAQELSTLETTALRRAGGTAVVGGLMLMLLTWIPGMPLHGVDGPFPRWVSAIVPLLFLGFLVPGLVYGATVGAIGNDKDVARMMSETMSGMGSYIVLSFFAAQFIAYFRYSNLGEMLAIRGGQVLAEAGLSASFLMVAFIGVVFVANMFVGSMSAKYAFFAPVFVPMFMQVGVSPELTQVAYRIGDSVSNVITPLNPYVVIILVFMQRYVPKAGIGTLIALMLPYTVAFALTWSVMLVLWILSGAPLGPGGPLVYGP